MKYNVSIVKHNQIVWTIKKGTFLGKYAVAKKTGHVCPVKNKQRGLIEAILPEPPHHDIQQRLSGITATWLVQDG